MIEKILYLDHKINPKLNPKLLFVALSFSQDERQGDL